MRSTPAEAGSPSSVFVLDLQQEPEPSTERCSKPIAKRIAKPNKPDKSVKSISMENTTEDSTMRRAHLTVALVGVVFGLGGLSFFGVRPGLSAFAGALVASANLLVLARTVQKMVQGAGASWAGVALIKFLVLLAVTYGLIQSGLVEPLGLAVGFGALPLGILLAGTFPAPALPSSALPADFRDVIDTNVKSDHA